MNTAKNITLALVFTLGGITGIIGACYLLCQFFDFITEKWGDHAVGVFILSTIGLAAFLMIFSHLQKKNTK